MTRLFIITALAVLLFPGKVWPQAGDFMECTACMTAVSIAETQAAGNTTELDMAGPCAILPQAERKHCAQSLGALGPKFLRAIKERRARGESLQQICGAMGYCR